MTDSREFNASTVEKALSKASAIVGVPEGEISYEVLDAGSDGFLGIGARDARISVFVADNEADAMTATEPGSEQGASASAAEDSSQGEDYRERLAPPPPSPTSERANDEDEREGENETVIVAPEYLVEAVKDYVSTVMDAMGLEARVDAYDTDECIAVDIASDHAALVIGQKGETIDSLQYLVNSAVYRDREFVKRVVLDSEGYRQRRIEAIQGMAHRTARKSVRERRDVEMPPMNSSERRVVHMYLKENPEVSTFSEGSGSHRRVTVSPN